MQPYLHGQLVFSKVAKTNLWGKEIQLKIVIDKLYTHRWKNEPQFISHIYTKINLKYIIALSIKAKISASKRN